MTHTHESEQHPKSIMNWTGAYYSTALSSVACVVINTIVGLWSITSARKFALITQVHPGEAMLRTGELVLLMAGAMTLAMTFALYKKRKRFLSVWGSQLLLVAYVCVAMFYMSANTELWFSLDVRLWPSGSK